MDIMWETDLEQISRDERSKERRIESSTKLEISDANPGTLRDVCGKFLEASDEIVTGWEESDFSVNQDQKERLEKMSDVMPGLIRNPRANDEGVSGSTLIVDQIDEKEGEIDVFKNVLQENVGDLPQRVEALKDLKEFSDKVGGNPFRGDKSGVDVVTELKGVLAGKREDDEKQTTATDVLFKKPKTEVESERDEDAISGG